MSLPEDFRTGAVDFLGVTGVALVIIFIPNLLKAVHDRDAELVSEVMLHRGEQPAQKVTPEDPAHDSLAKRVNEAERAAQAREAENIKLGIEKTQHQSRATELEARLRDANDTIRQLRAQAAPAPELSVTRTVVAHTEGQRPSLEMRLENTGTVGVTVRVGLSISVKGKAFVLREPKESLRLATKTRLDLSHQDVALDIAGGQVSLIASYEHEGRTLCYSYVGNVNLSTKTLNYVRGDTAPCRQ